MKVEMTKISQKSPSMLSPRPPQKMLESRQNVALESRSGLAGAKKRVAISHISYS
jgi:hypothetical protein